MHASARHLVPRAFLAGLIAAGMLAGCASAGPFGTPESPRTVPALTLDIVYPSEGAEFSAGQPLRVTVVVTDAQGTAADQATVRLTIEDESGSAQVEQDAVPGGEGVFRSPAWTIPDRADDGLWSAEVLAASGEARGVATRRFVVTPSTSRILHDKYGFWIAPPSLRGIVPLLDAERGDASNGMIRWGGSLPAAHILPSAWIDLHWRQGDFDLTSPDAARRFLLEQVGNFGATRVRSLGEPRQIAFQGWQAWLVPMRGELRYEQVEWLVFYAPEVERTYAIGTTVVEPPEGINPHEVLRRGFEVDADVEATGRAPEPLARLLPGPALTAPDLGAEFSGEEAKIILRWEPLGPLKEDEYYEVTVGYAYSESTTLARYRTREAWLQLPPELYGQPNCRVFNWSVRLMQSAGEEAGDEAQDVPLSYSSLYSFVVWTRPAGDPAPFLPWCPNEQT